MKFKYKIATGCLGTLAILMASLIIFGDLASPTEVNAQRTSTPVASQPSVEQEDTGQANSALVTSSTVQSPQPAQQERGGFLFVKAWSTELGYGAGAIGVIGMVGVLCIFVLSRGNKLDALHRERAAGEVALTKKEQAHIVALEDALKVGIVDRYDSMDKQTLAEKLAAAHTLVNNLQDLLKQFNGTGDKDKKELPRFPLDLFRLTPKASKLCLAELIAAELVTHFFVAIPDKKVSKKVSEKPVRQPVTLDTLQGFIHLMQKVGYLPERLSALNERVEKVKKQAKVVVASVNENAWGKFQQRLDQQAVLKQFLGDNKQVEAKIQHVCTLFKDRSFGAFLSYLKKDVNRYLLYLNAPSGSLLVDDFVHAMLGWGSKPDDGSQGTELPPFPCDEAERVLALMKEVGYVSDLGDHLKKEQIAQKKVELIGLLGESERNEKEICAQSKVLMNLVDDKKGDKKGVGEYLKQARLLLKKRSWNDLLENLRTGSYYYPCFLLFPYDNTSCFADAIAGFFAKDSKEDKMGLLEAKKVLGMMKKVGCVPVGFAKSVGAYGIQVRIERQEKKEAVEKLVQALGKKDKDRDNGEIEKLRKVIKERSGVGVKAKIQTARSDLEAGCWKDLDYFFYCNPNYLLLAYNEQQCFAEAIAAKIVSDQDSTATFAQVKGFSVLMHAVGYVPDGFVDDVAKMRAKGIKKKMVSLASFLGQGGQLGQHKEAILATREALMELVVGGKYGVGSLLRVARNKLLWSNWGEGLLCLEKNPYLLLFAYDKKQCVAEVIAERFITSMTYDQAARFFELMQKVGYVPKDMKSKVGLMEEAFIKQRKEAQIEQIKKEKIWEKEVELADWLAGSPDELADIKRIRGELVELVGGEEKVSIALKEAKSLLKARNWEALLGHLQTRSYLLLLLYDEKVCFAEAIATDLAGSKDDGKMTIEQTEGFLALMQGDDKEGYVPKDFKQCVEHYRQQVEQERQERQKIVEKLAQELRKKNKERNSEEILRLRNEIKKLFGEKKVSTALQEAKPLLKMRNWGALLEYLQTRSYLLLLLYDKKACFTEAIAGDIASERYAGKITYRGAYRFLKLMEAVGGYVPDAIDQYVSGWLRGPGYRKLSKLLGGIDVVKENVKKVSGWVESSQGKQWLPFLRKGVNRYLLLVRIGDNDQRITLAKVMVNQLMKQGNKRDDKKVYGDQALYSFAQMEVFLKLMGKVGYRHKGFMKHVAKMRTKEIKKKMVAVADYLRDGGQLGKHQGEICKTRGALMELVGGRKAVGEELKKARNDLEKNDWDTWLKLLQERPYFSLLQYNEKMCFAEAIAHRLMQKNHQVPFPVEQAFGLLKLMQGSDDQGYVPMRFKRYVEGMKKVQEDKEQTEKTLVGELVKSKQDRKVIKTLQEKLAKSMKNLGVGKVATKMVTAYSQLKKTAWDALLGLLASCPLHGLLLLLKSGDGDAVCLADAITVAISKGENSKKMTYKQVVECLRLMDAVGYVPKVFKQHVNDLLKQAGTKELVALLDSNGAKMKGVERWLKRSQKKSSSYKSLQFLFDGVNRYFLWLNVSKDKDKDKAKSLADAIAERMVKDKYVTYKEAFDFYGLMEKIGYLPIGFKDFVEKKALLAQKKKRVAGQLEQELNKATRDNNQTSIEKLRGELEELFGEELGSQKAQANEELIANEWGRLLGFFRSNPYCLLLVYYQGGPCFAEVIATKMPKDKRVTYDEAFDFLKLMQGSDGKGYVPSGFREYVNGLIAQAGGTTRLVALLGGREMVDREMRKMRKWLDDGQLKRLLPFLHDGVNRYLLQLDVSKDNKDDGHKTSLAGAIADILMQWGEYRDISKENNKEKDDEKSSDNDGNEQGNGGQAPFPVEQALQFLKLMQDAGCVPEGFRAYVEEMKWKAIVQEQQITVDPTDRNKREIAPKGGDHKSSRGRSVSRGIKSLSPGKNKLKQSKHTKSMPKRGRSRTRIQTFAQKITKPFRLKKRGPKGNQSKKSSKKRTRSLSPKVKASSVKSERPNPSSSVQSDKADVLVL